MKRWKALAGAAIAAALVVAPLVSTGAYASESKMVGVIGELQPWTAATNKTSYWENLYKDHKASCYKYDDDDSNKHGRITDDEKAVTLKPFNQAWPGDHWELLVVYGGSVSNNVIHHPSAGVAYASPKNAKGKQSEVSHWIVCTGKTPPQPEPVVITPTLSYTDADCDAAGTLTTSDEGVTWSVVVNDDGSRTYTATAEAGFVIADGATTTWNVPDLAQLPADSSECRAPVAVPAAFSAEPAAPSCGLAGALPSIAGEHPNVTLAFDREFDGPGTYTLTAAADAGYEFPDGTTVKQREIEVGAALEFQSEDPQAPCYQAAAEQELIPGEITSQCVGTVPYLGYAVSLPDGFETDGDTPLTITFVHPTDASQNHVVSNLELSGTLLWPGASAGTPQQWPGWVQLPDGTYVETDGNFAWTRAAAGVTVRFDVNPTFETVVNYPPESALCADATPASASSDTTGPTGTTALPATGGPDMTPWGISAAVMLLAGGALLGTRRLARR